MVLALLLAAWFFLTPSGDVGLGDGAYYLVSTYSAFLVVSSIVSISAVLVTPSHPVVASLLASLPFLMVPWTNWFVWGWYLALLMVLVVGTVLHGWRHAILPFSAAALVAVWFCGTGSPALTPIGPVTSGGNPGYQTEILIAYLVALVIVTGAALTVRATRLAMQSQHAASERTRQADEVATLAQERARMARDLHDVVAHHVSLIAVRAESAPYRMPDLSDGAREQLDAVAQDARTALEELRHALTVLQRTDDGGPAVRRPQPGTADIGQLLSEAADAGQRVELVGDWPEPVDAARGYVLYRAVQEALSNARRHAPGRPVRVLRKASGNAVGVVISQPLAAPVADVVPGRGLVGMRERVEAVGGSLTLETGGSAFTVRVELPDGGAA